jgi:hypothetical protein
LRPDGDVALLEGSSFALVMPLTSDASSFGAEELATMAVVSSGAVTAIDLGAIGMAFRSCSSGAGRIRYDLLDATDCSLSASASVSAPRV